MAAEDPAARGLEVRLRQAGPIPLDVAFSCRPGEVVALFGPSGSGKTTTLRAVAGLHRPREGRVACNDRCWLDTGRGIELPPHQRRVGLVFQDYALFPHLSVLGNVRVALGHLPPAQRAGRAQALLGQVHLQDLADRRPGQLSGGQRQRVALARALARDPAVLLLDEPFAAVDRPARAALYAELETLRRDLKIPMILVTHDFNEVARLADRIVVLDQGRQVAAGPVAEIAGREDLPSLALDHDPGVLLEGRVRGHDEARELTALAVGTATLLIPRTAVGVGAGIRVQVSARDITLALTSPTGISTRNILAGTVAAVAPAPNPALLRVTVATGAGELLVQVTRDAGRELGLTAGQPVFALLKSVSLVRAGA